MNDIYKLLFIIATEVIRIIITSRFANSFVEKTEDHIKRIGAYACSVVITTTAYFFFNLAWLNLISTLAGLVIISLPYYGKVKKKVQFVLYVLAISCIIDLVVYALLSNTFDYENYSAPASILSLFLLFVVQLVTRRVLMKNKNEELDSPHWWRYIVSLVVCIAVSLIVIMDDTISPLSLSAVCGAFLVINLIIVYLFEDLIETRKNEYENLILRDQARAYEKELLMQQEKTDEMKAFRHDIKHHLAQMKALNDGKHVDKLDRYIQEVADNLQETVPMSYTGNIGVDGVLNYMLQKAKDKGIAVTSKVVIPEDLEISVFDMNIILGNLFENAIEANDGVEKPRIGFVMKYVKEAILIEISNTRAHKVNIKNNAIISTKKQVSLHGYGLRNIKKVLAKYDHLLDLEDVDDEFVVRIMMKI